MAENDDQIKKEQDGASDDKRVPAYAKGSYVSNIEADEMFKTWIETGSTARVATIHGRAHTTVLRVKAKNNWDERKAKIKGRLNEQTDRSISQNLKELDDYLSACIAKGVTDFIGREDSGVNAGGLSSLIKTKMELRGINALPSGDVKELGLFYGIIAGLTEEQIDRFLLDGKSILDRIDKKASG